MKTRSIIALIPACTLALAIPAFAEDTKHHDSDYNKDREYKGAYDHALTPAKFVHKALKCGHKEVSLSKLANERAQDPEVKAFASNLITAHESANDRLMTIAREKGFPTSDTNVVSRPYERSESNANRNLADAVNSLAFAQNGRGEPFFPGGAPIPPTDTESPRRDTNTKDHDRVYKADEEYNRLQALQGAEFDRAFVRQMITDHNDAIALFTRASRDIEDSELKAFASDTLPTLQSHLSEAERLAGRGLTANR